MVAWRRRGGSTPVGVAPGGAGCQGGRAVGGKGRLIFLYSDPTQLPWLKRIIFDNTLGQKEAIEPVKTAAGQVDLVTNLSPLETLSVAQSSLPR
jgi:hypothetical protein